MNCHIASKAGESFTLGNQPLEYLGSKRSAEIAPEVRADLLCDAHPPGSGYEAERSESIPQLGAKCAQWYKILIINKIIWINIDS